MHVKFQDKQTKGIIMKPNGILGPRLQSFFYVFFSDISIFRKSSVLIETIKDKNVRPSGEFCHQF
jgi:hypothetical protein